jgi:hypothetical protein
MDSIFVKNVRVLTPDDYDNILSQIDKPYQRRRFLILFWSGMRYAEFQRFYNHPEWYSKTRNAIHLPEWAQKKVKRKQLDRWVHPLPDLIHDYVSQFHDDPEPPTNQGWNQSLKRWAKAAGMDSTGISAKTTRKSIESWMIAGGVPENVVYLRQGHDRITSLQHYQGLPFTLGEKVEIKRRFAGWV